MEGVLAVFLCCGAYGCRAGGTTAEVGAGGLRRPPELDLLDAFVGRWEVTGEVTTPGAGVSRTFTGENEAHWEGGGWYLVSRGVSRMAENGETEGLAVWRYDTDRRTFRGTNLNSNGEVGEGSARYDDDTDTWVFRMTSRGPTGKSRWRGTVRFVEVDTKEEHWVGHAMGGGHKIAEINKTERRLKDRSAGADAE
jgi:hypothetical protein